MNTAHDPVNPCTTLGHVYSMVLVTRCPHLEAHHVRVRVWYDTGTDDAHTVWEREISFGPFDSWAWVEERVLDLTALAMDHQNPPGPL